MKLSGFKKCGKQNDVVFLFEQNIQMENLHHITKTTNQCVVKRDQIVNPYKFQARNSKFCTKAYVFFVLYVFGFLSMTIF